MSTYNQMFFKSCFELFLTTRGQEPKNSRGTVNFSSFHGNGVHRTYTATQGIHLCRLCSPREVLIISPLVCPPFLRGDAVGYACVFAHNGFGRTSALSAAVIVLYTAGQSNQVN